MRFMCIEQRCLEEAAAYVSKMRKHYLKERERTRKSANAIVVGFPRTKSANLNMIDIY